jgi:putative flippase GtrA
MDNEKKRSIKQFIKYLTIGAASNASGYTIYLVLTKLNISPMYAMSIVYIAGAIIGFYGNRQWTFGCKNKVVSTTLKYGLTHLFGFLLNFMILLFFVDKLQYPHELVQGIALFVVAAFLFVCFKLFVFKDVYKGETT